MRREDGVHGRGLVLAPILVAALVLALAAFPSLALAAGGAVDRFSFLHVGPPSGPGNLAQILDDHGRSVLLRGINVNGLEDYYSSSSTPTAVPYPTDPLAYASGRCPQRNATVESMAVCDFDAAQMRGFGYDVVRVAVSWSLLEPQPGRIDQAYIDRIAQVVGWLRSQGLYSVIDMHQDAWSKYLYTPPGGTCPPPLSPVTGAHEADGAPEWASVHVTPVCQAAAREVDAAVQEDFQRFWSNEPGPDGVGLQDHFAGAVLALARRFGADPAVAGYDLFNEPSPGFLPPPAMDAAEVFPFYAKVVQTVRDGVPGFRQLFFVEPDVTRDVTDQRYAVAPWSTFSGYPNVVYAPHIYTHVFTPDAEASAPGLGPLYPVSGGYDSAAADARALGLPLWDGEFGTDVASDETTLRQHYESQDRLAVGGVLWIWKADGTAQQGGFSAMQGPFGRGTPFPSRVKFTDRAYPVYTAGELQSLRYDPDHSTFDLRATSTAVAAGDRSRATLVYVPAGSRGRVVATGATLEVRALSDGARAAYVFPRGGAYHVFEAAAVPPRRGRRPAARRARARLRLSVSPRAVTAGRLVTLRMRVTARVAGRTRAVAGAVARVAGRRLVTDRRGRAVLRMRFRRAGRYSVTATRRGYAPASSVVRVHAESVRRRALFTG